MHVLIYFESNAFQPRAHCTEIGVYANANIRALDCKLLLAKYLSVRFGAFI